MTVIGITGPTGAGKTTVLNVLAELGGAILDCDAVYHELLKTDRDMKNELKIRFGGEIFDENGDLRRKALGAIVFEDAGALGDLNAITHRYVTGEVKARLEKARAEGCPAAALDAIALLESGMGALCDATVAVTASEETRVRRIMAREGISEEYARARAAAQKPNGFFEDACDYTLRNDADRQTLEREARALFEKLMGRR